MTATPDANVVNGWLAGAPRYEAGGRYARPPRQASHASATASSASVCSRRPTS